MSLVIQSKQIEPDLTVVEMSGKITMGDDCKQIESTTQKLLSESRKKIIFDLSGVTHIDSSAIGTIVKLAAQVKAAGGELRVASASPHINQLLKITNVSRIISLHPTIAAAAKEF